VPVHFLDLASAVEKLRWAEKEWRELDNAPVRPEARAAEGDSFPSDFEDEGSGGVSMDIREGQAPPTPARTS